jgi:hypothetical protein
MAGNETPPAGGLSSPVRSLLLQVVPILVFLAVDALSDSVPLAIGAALAFVVVQTILNRVRGRPFDRFLLLDLALVGGMGAASLFTRNELFFKLKPAILEAVMLPFTGFLALAPERVLVAYLGRYAPAPPAPQALPLLRRLLGLMTILIAIHAGLTVLAALRLSRGAWAAVSGPGFYAILLPVLGYALWLRLRARRAASQVATADPPPPTPRIRRRRRR